MSALQQVGEQLNKCFFPVQSYLSEQSGAGKSFQVRLRAQQDVCRYVHFPVFQSAECVPRLYDTFTSLSTVDGESTLYDRMPELWHFDVQATVREDFNSYLFEVVFFSSLVSSRRPVFLLFHPQWFRFAIEMASGSPASRVGVSLLLARQEVRVNAASFCADAQQLRAGMGDQYRSVRYDGTAAAKQHEGLRAANAFQRLQYVCVALDMIDRLEGRFPYVFEGPTLSALDSLRMSQSTDVDGATQSIPAARCFRLLLRAANLSSDLLSLWCLWNFVNVLHWQLRDMHFDNSIINLACMPASERDVYIAELSALLPKPLSPASERRARKQQQKQRLSDDLPAAATPAKKEEPASEEEAQQASSKKEEPDKVAGEPKDEQENAGQRSPATVGELVGDNPGIPAAAARFIEVARKKELKLIEKELKRAAKAKAKDKAARKAVYEAEKAGAASQTKSRGRRKGKAAVVKESDSSDEEEEEDVEPRAVTTLEVEFVKGDFVRLLCVTARQLAIRLTKQTERQPERIIAVITYNTGIQYMLHRHPVSLRPAFAMRGGHLLYYRSAEQRWVITSSSISFITVPEKERVHQPDHNSEPIAYSLTPDLGGLWWNNEGTVSDTLQQHSERGRYQRFSVSEDYLEIMLLGLWNAAAGGVYRAACVPGVKFNSPAQLLARKVVWQLSIGEKVPARPAPPVDTVTEQASAAPQVEAPQVEQTPHFMRLRNIPYEHYADDLLLELWQGVPEQPGLLVARVAFPTRMTFPSHATCFRECITRRFAQLRLENGKRVSVCRWERNLRAWAQQGHAPRWELGYSYALGTSSTRDDIHDDTGVTPFRREKESVLHVHAGQEESMQAIFQDTLPWQEIEHCSVLFSNETGKMHLINLAQWLCSSEVFDRVIVFAADKLCTKNLVDSGTLLDVLGEITGVRKNLEDVLEGKYCLTTDNLLKMLAVYARIRCGLPVLLMGECGCGKTMLIRFLCAWMDAMLLVLDINGGTSDHDIVNIFARATHLVQEANDPQCRVYVFLDEINTCPHMGLITEVVCNRTLYGKPIADQIVVLGALNPHRRRPPSVAATPGLVFTPSTNRHAGR
jgi:hypothetical protein